MNKLRDILNGHHFLKAKRIVTAYHIMIAVMAVVSILLVILDLTNTINILVMPYALINDFILTVFTIDYVGRFIRATNRWKFFYTNIFDLLAIVPFSSIFSLFRLARLASLARIFLLFRVVGLSGKLTRNLHRFFYGTGLMYVLYIVIIMLLVASAIFSQAENVSFGNAMWWAIVTVTTVGYGDVTPHTMIGRGLAIVLMITGIGLIGTLTSAITNVVSRTAGENAEIEFEESVAVQEIQELHAEIRALTKTVNELKSIQLKQNKK